MAAFVEHPQFIAMIAIFLIAALVGLVWGAALLRRGDLLAGCLMVLAAGCCFGHPFLLVRFGPIPLTTDRLLMALLVVLYGIYRKCGLTDPKPLRKAEIVLGVFLAVLVVSVLAHDWRSDNGQPAVWLTLFYLMPAAMYWVGRQSKLHQRNLWWVFGGLAVFGVYLSVTAVAEVRQAWWLVFPRYIASPEHWEFFGRGRGPLLHPIGNGWLLSVCLCSVWTAWPRWKGLGKVVPAAVCLLLLAGVFCTLTRSVWLGGVASLFVLISLTTPRSWWMAIVCGAVLALALLLAAKWDHFLAFKRDKNLSAHNVAASAKLRPVLAAVAWRMFLDRPLFGCGFAHYGDESGAYLSDRSTEIPLQQARGYVQHNVFLALLTETGLAGLGLFVALLAFWARDAWRLWRSPQAPLWARNHGLLVLGALAAYLPNAMFHDLSLTPMVNMLLFFLAGVLAGLAPLAGAAATREPAPRLAAVPQPIHL